MKRDLEFEVGARLPFWIALFAVIALLAAAWR